MGATGHEFTGFWSFHLDEPEEPVKGKPRMVYLEKEDYRSGQPVDVLKILARFDTDGRITDRRVYRGDGSLSCHESFEYEADQPLCTVRMLDSQGALLSTRQILTGPDCDESVVTDASGEIVEKTATARDPEGGIVEATSAGVAGNNDIRMTVTRQAGQEDAHVTLGEGLRIQIVTGPEGGRVTFRDADGREHEFTRYRRRAAIESTDARGNWTRKTIFDRDPSTGEEVLAVAMNRKIEYYSG